MKISNSFYVCRNDLFHDDDVIVSGNDCDTSDCEHVHDCDVNDCVHGYRAFLLGLLCFQNLSLTPKSRVNGFLYKAFCYGDDANASVLMNADDPHDDYVNTHGDHH